MNFLINTKIFQLKQAALLCSMIGADNWTIFWNNQAQAFERMKDD